jgi:4-azaleucine resistance transporter AzlC
MPGRRPTHFRRDALALAIGVGVFGVAFGVFATAAGLTVAQASAMSLLTFTGASQFAAVGVIGTGGSPAAALGSALLLAARNGLYGVSLSTAIRGRLPRRLLGAQLVIDESTGMALAQGDPDATEQAFWFTGAAVFVCWNVGTLLGALGGQALGDPAALGLDAAFPAGFIALLAPLLRDRQTRTAAAAGVVLAAIAIPVLPPGAPILAASLGVVPALLVRDGGATRP